MNPGMDPETFEQFIEQLRRYVRERLIPAEEEVIAQDRIPDDILAEMREMGLFGITIPEEFGGAGMNISQYVETVKQLSFASPAYRSTVSINIGMTGSAIKNYGTPEQKAEWLPRIAGGEIACFGLTEPGSGSDSAAMQTTAVRDGNGYRLNGTKRYITNSPHAKIGLIMARTSKEALPKNAHVSAFIVDMTTPGITIGKPDKKMGQRGTKTCDVNMDNVRVPAANIIGGVPGQGFKTAMKVLDRGRLNISAVSCGMASRILDESVRYASERKQFGKPIGEFQLIQAMLADSQAELLAAWSLVREVAARFDQKPAHLSDPDVSMRVSCAKLFATEMLGRVADRGVQVHGGAGYINEYPVERFYRDARLLRLYEGTTQVQQLIIGRELLRQAA